MDSRLFFVVCFLTTCPLAAGADGKLKCYSCQGTSIDGAADKCVDGVLSDADSKDCVKEIGKVMKCSLAKVKGDGNEVVKRACTSMPSGTKDECAKAEAEGIETHACFCSTDNCNGQTTLAPVIVTCLVSLLLAINVSE